MATRLEQQQCAEAMHRLTLDTNTIHNKMKIIEYSQFLIQSVCEDAGGIDNPAHYALEQISNRLNEDKNKEANKEKYKEEFEYLDDLRDSGRTNMFGAAPYLASKFEIKIQEARKILTLWMESHG